MREGESYYYYHNDHLGTPQKLTAQNGQVVWSAKYTAFGEAEIDLSSTIVNNLRVSGQYFDQETDLHYNYFRYYNPKIGRYLTEDPIRLSTGEVNLYSFVFGNPIRFIDPFGLYSWDDFIFDAADFSAGWGDTLSFGITNQIRELLGTNSVVNKCSTPFKLGEVFGFLNDIGIGWAGGMKTAFKQYRVFSHSFIPDHIPVKSNFR